MPGGAPMRVKPVPRPKPVLDVGDRRAAVPCFPRALFPCAVFPLSHSPHQRKERAVKANHLPPTATPDEVAAALRADGYVIVDNLVSGEVMDRVAAELDPYVDLTPVGRDDFVGRLTRRTGSLIARSEASRGLIAHPLALATAAEMLKKATAYQLHLTQVISVFPGETNQPLHRDELAWDFFPFPPDYDVQCNTIWAMTDFTAENGATRVVPGSHLKPGKQDYTDADTIQAEMSRGSVFFYTGKVYHGAAANKTDQIRQGINLTYAVGWVRQEENQYLSTPIEVAKTLDDDFLKLMGYQMGGLAMGYIRDFEDPMVAVRDNLPRQQYDFAAQMQTNGHLNANGVQTFYSDLVSAETPAELSKEPA
jgi:ectoine hydroxylase-related dioxygenase (phytanoyl-CoA dioxygenase family)